MAHRAPATSADRRNSRAFRLTAIAFAVMLVVAGYVNHLVFGWRMAVAFPLFGLFVGGLGLHYYDGFKRMRTRRRDSTADQRPRN